MIVHETVRKLVLLPQAKIVWSGDTFISSSRSRQNAEPPSPYIVGMLIPKIPVEQYASSSTQVVCRLEAHDIRSAMLTIRSWRLHDSTFASILVIVSMCSTSSVLVSRTVQSLRTNKRCVGARSSWSVQPLVNQRLSWEYDCGPE